MPYMEGLKTGTRSWRWGQMMEHCSSGDETVRLSGKRVSPAFPLVSKKQNFFPWEEAS
jgi:hypothetical protein